MRRRQDPVRYLIDYRNQREQERRERQRAARKTEAKLLAEQAIAAVIGFWILTWASGILG